MKLFKLHLQLFQYFKQ